MHEKLDIVALGGNAMLPAGGAGTITEQVNVTRSAMEQVAGLLEEGRRVVLTHGNGPIVGNIVIRNEAAKDIIAPMPLDVCGADSQGGIGYMIQQTLRNVLVERGVEREIVALVTQVVVAADDPAFSDPVKPIGPFFTQGEAEAIERDRGWKMKRIGRRAEKMRRASDRSFRRVVASPQPIAILEKDVIGRLVDAGTVVITVGGGGIPVIIRDGGYEGVEAVIDKDLASSLLARDLGAERLIILTDVDAVYENYGTDDARALREASLAEIEELYERGQFPEGSMGSKMRAVMHFIEGGGRAAIIARPCDLTAASTGSVGTTILPSAPHGD